MARAAERILLRGPQPGAPGGALDAAFVHFGTMALLQLGVQSWTRWSGALPSALATTQVRSGANAGSWDPGTPDAVEMGRAGTTALLVLTGTVCSTVARVMARR